MFENDPAKQAYEAFAGVYDDFNAANDYETWFEVLLPRLGELGLRQGALLDVACGTGRAFGPMLRRGWAITAVDISPAMVAKAREKFPDDIVFHVGDMRELPVYGSFELVWALNDPANYLLGDDDLATALSAMRANLAPDGLVAFDCNTRRLFREFFSRPAEETERDERFRWEGKGGDGTFFEAEMSGEGVDTHVHRERHRPVDEVQATLRAVGLEPLAAIGQHDTEVGLILADDWDEDRDHKIVHVARLA